MAESKKSTKKAPQPRADWPLAEKKSKAPQRQEEIIKPMEEVERLRGILESLDAEIGEKELALIGLAHLGTEEANNVIEGFILNLEAMEDAGIDELSEWAMFALEEGEFFASVPTSPEEEEEMIREAVYQEYIDRYCELEAKIEEVEEEIDKREYEFAVVKRLSEKAKTKQAKEDWSVQEAVRHDLLVWEESRKEQLENELKIVEAMIDEIEPELETKS